MLSILNNLVETNDSFFFKDFVKDGITYRIFNYRFASYSDFLEEGAKECRGIMFRIGDANSPRLYEIVSRPMDKFWNLYENPFTSNINLNDVEYIMEKADGSLISSYIHLGKLYLKSKGSLESEQAIAAMEYLFSPEQDDLHGYVWTLSKKGHTVNMEWCAPDNRIVLHYPTPHLKILNIRHNKTGQYLDLTLENNPILEKYMVGFESFTDPVEFINSIPDMKGVEGFVCKLRSGQFFKVKTTEYIALHHTKDSINNPRRLYEAVLGEASDDLRSLFHDDEQAISLIANMEQFVEREMNKLVKEVETFYITNKHMERKEYAVKAQQTVNKLSFSLVMSLYTGRSIDYYDFMKKKWKEFGVKDFNNNVVEL